MYTNALRGGKSYLSNMIKPAIEWQWYRVATTASDTFQWCYINFTCNKFLLLAKPSIKFQKVKALSLISPPPWWRGPAARWSPRVLRDSSSCVFALPVTAWGRRRLVRMEDFILTPPNLKCIKIKKNVWVVYKQLKRGRWESPLSRGVSLKPNLQPLHDLLQHLPCGARGVPGARLSCRHSPWGWRSVSEMID